VTTRAARPGEARRGRKRAWNRFARKRTPARLFERSEALQYS